VMSDRLHDQFMIQIIERDTNRMPSSTTRLSRTWMRSR
jgi:hypothetical protein